MPDSSIHNRVNANARPFQPAAGDRVAATVVDAGANDRPGILMAEQGCALEYGSRECDTLIIKVPSLKGQAYLDRFFAQARITTTEGADDDGEGATPAS